MITEIRHTGIVVQDLKKVLNFFTKLLRFKIKKKMNEKGSYIDNILGLKNVKAEHQRAENIQGTYDFVVSRAVTRMAPFVDWIKHKFNKNHFNPLDNGILYLKGGDLEEELAEAKRKYTMYDLPNFFREEFFETKKVVYLPF
jgi:16S rRNA (guanine527-N7)-methyltransferase